MSTHCLYHLTYDRDRYYLNVRQAFTESAVEGVQLDTGFEFHLLDADGVVQRIYRKNEGITEVEDPDDYFVYEIHEELVGLDVVGISGLWVAESGGNAVTPDDVEIEADVDNPDDVLAVSSTSVTNGATGVDPKVEPRIVFDKEIDKTSVSQYGLIFLCLDDYKPHPVSLTVDTSTSIIIAPNSVLKPKTRYRLILQSAAEDKPILGTDGSALAEKYIIDFTTGAEAFTSISSVSEPGSIERTAPLRIVTGTEDLDPAYFSNGTTSRCLSGRLSTDTIEISFNKDIDVVDIEDYVDVQISAALGGDEYYADLDGELYYPDEPETVPEVDTITFDDNVVTITFTEPLLYNTVVLVTFTNLVMDDATKFTGTYKHITKLYPSYSTPVMMKLSLGAFKDSTMTDCDLLLYDHMAAVEGHIYYGSAVYEGPCKLAFRNMIRANAIVSLMNDWMSKNGVVGSSQQLGDFKVSLIPRPESIIGSATAPGVMSSAQKEANKWQAALNKCMGYMRTVDHKSYHTNYPLDLRIRGWALDYSTKIIANGLNERIEKSDKA